ncbi:MAG: pyruvate formate lyase family protein [Actinomycetota bacterium]
MTTVTMASEVTDATPPPMERIRRIQRRYQTGDAWISIQRARYYTESWRATEGEGMALPVRVAMAMKNVYENVDLYIDPDDRLAGNYTEFFLGIPIDVERGLFNQVLESELLKSRMVRLRATSLFKGLLYILRNGNVREFLRNARLAGRHGRRPLDMMLQTMQERKINPFQIRDEDRRELLREILPYWKGRTMVSVLEEELAGAGLFSGTMHDFTTSIAGNTSRQVLMLSPCATIATPQGHLVLDYESVLEKGLDGIGEEVRARLESGDPAPGEKDFLAALEISVQGVATFARRLAGALKREVAACTDPGRKEELDRMLATCERVPFAPATTFFDAVQSIWTVKTAVELAHPVNFHCFGRLDQSLYPYYRKDIEEGRTTPAEACELLGELLLKVMTQNMRPESNLLGNFYHRFLGSAPITLGGVTPGGEDATNDLTYLFLQAAHASRAITNVSLRVHPGTPQRLLMELAGYLHDGTSSYALFNDEVIIDAMERRGFSEADARDYAIMGCVEATCPGRTGSMSANALLLVRLLDMTLRNGDSKLLAGTVRGEGPATGDPDDFEDFEEFLEAFFRQARFQIKRIVEGSNLRDRLYAERLPAPCISAFTDGCLESGKDVTAGGARYDLSGISMINSIANLVDSLFVIKRLIFEERKFTFHELLAALDDDFEGHGDIYREIVHLSGKWGNGSPETDELSARVTDELFRETYKYRNYKGGPFVVYVISMITHTIDGRLSAASPDGRRIATPYAASCNPYNVERSGVTATLRSVASLPMEHVMGCAVNVKFHPTGVGDRPETREKWIALVRSYFEMGGAQIQPTVASAEMLKEAQRDPAGHRELIVKVGGYSTYFTDLGNEIQDEIIARTEQH